jgi:hypothetical protein
MRAMKSLLLALATAFALVAQPPAAQSPYRTLDDRFAPPQFSSVQQWNARRAYLREHVLASAGLLPMPEKTPLNPVIFGEIKKSDYTVSKVYFESLPGFFVTGNLYRPVGNGPFPAVLSPHGHWAYGRLENTSLNSGPGRAINLARQGFVVFTYDMVGYNDSQQVPHTFSGQREYLWGLSLSGLQLWDSIRAIDFLESLPYVRRDAIAMTGESGGGTQTFLASAVDDRIAVSVPVNMISLHMQGGCLCENPPGLRLETTNVEIAATIAPRPLLMISATGDWTAETLEKEYPAVRAIYNLFDAGDRVNAVRITAEHNYNKDSREAMYAWMARWLQNKPADVKVAERSFTPESIPNLLVFHGRPLPTNAVDVPKLTENWIAAAKQQLGTGDANSFKAALRHSLGFANEEPARQGPAYNDSVTPPNRRAARQGPPDNDGAAPPNRRAARQGRPDNDGAAPPNRRAARQGRPDNDGAAPPNRRAALHGPPFVLLATPDADLERALTKAGMKVSPVTFTKYDADAAAKVHHFETYNRTPASQRIADIVAAVRAHPGAVVIAEGDAALAAILADAIEPISMAILDVAQFDTSKDQAFVDHLYIPGLRRAGDLATAASMVAGQLVVHNAGTSFSVKGVDARAAKLTPAEIVALLTRPRSTRTR